MNLSRHRSSFYRNRRSESGSPLIEMVPMVMIVIPTLLFLVSLASLAAGWVTLNLTCQQAAREAGAIATQSLASRRVDSLQTSLLNNGPFSHFGGVSNGTLTLVVQKAGNGTTDFVDVLPGDKVAPNDFVYRYRVSGKCDIKPLFWPISLNGVECFGLSVVEHPEGLF